MPFPFTSQGSQAMWQSNGSNEYRDNGNPPLRVSDIELIRLIVLLIN